MAEGYATDSINNEYTVIASSAHPYPESSHYDLRAEGKNRCQYILQHGVENSTVVIHADRQRAHGRNGRRVRTRKVDNHCLQLFYMLIDNCGGEG